MVDEQTSNFNAFKSILKQIGYILCFAVPATILSLLFPAYAFWFVLAAMVLMFAIVSYIVSRGWDNPEMTDEVRKSIRDLAVVISIGLPLIHGITNSIRSVNWMKMVYSIEISASFAVSIYIPFFIGRAISRRRTGH